MIRPLIRKLINPIAAAYFPTKSKEYNELRFWENQKRKHGGLSNDVNEPFYIAYSGLSKYFYDTKVVLDIGCGPRGNLRDRE